MSVFDPTHDDEQSDASDLFMESVDFPHVVALPTQQRLREGDLYSFRFGNGYGALVLRRARVPLSRAFEFCLLDCAGEGPIPMRESCVCQGIRGELSRGEVGQLLAQAEQLPRHPAWQNSDLLLDEPF